MKRYTVSVIANVTIDLIIDAKDESAAKSVADSMSYEDLVEEGIIRVYSTEEVDEDQDVKPYEEEKSA